MKPMYNPIDKLNYDDLTLDKYIFNLYENIDKTIYSPPYIVIGHSHGIYYASEFARQFLFNVKYVISLDGSWITKKLNKERLKRWEIKEKIVTKIKNQEQLDDILHKIKTEKDNEKYINIIFDYVKWLHTKWCIKYILNKNYFKIILKLHKISLISLIEYSFIPNALLILHIGEIFQFEIK